MRTINNKVAIVTGASRGIGRGVALGLGAAGWTVYVTGRTVGDRQSDRPGSVTKTAEEVTAAGGRGMAAPCDHRVDSETAAVFQRVQNEHGHLDLLVNNATSYTTDVGPPDAPFWEIPLDMWDQMHTVGLRSHFVASILAAKIMIPQRAGLIVNISSLGAIKYAGGNASYNVVKAGVDMMTVATAFDLRPHGVAVVSLWPRLTRTEGVMAHPELFSDLSNAWSPEFNGRLVAALAADPQVIEKTGRALDIAEVANEYGIADSDGKRPAPLKPS